MEYDTPTLEGGVERQPYGPVWVLPTERTSQLGVNKYGEFNIHRLEPGIWQGHIFYI